MIELATISHAVVLDDGEVSQLQAHYRSPLRRRTGTKLRARIALFHESARTIVGTATLSDATKEGEESYSLWHFEEVAWLSSPLAVSTTRTGPIWIRLLKHDRTALRALQSGFAEEPRPTSLSQADKAPEPLEGTEVQSIQGADASVIELPSESTAEAPLNVEHFGEGAHPDAELDGQPEASADPILAARARAAAFVPQTNVSPGEARQILVRLRDDEIKPAFPGVPPSFGILRRAMLQSLLEEGVATLEDYSRLIPEDLRSATNEKHVSAYLDSIIAILAKIQESAPDVRSVASPSVTKHSTTAPGVGWSDAELQAAVASYAEMLRWQDQGVPYNKAATIRRLQEGPLRARTAASVTLRWQNIAHLLAEAGRPTVDGFKPAANVGENIARRIAPMLLRHKLL
ncbi:hypothetical protein GCM10022280_18740 [Sphingomonas swuensis]|uniref:Uncharacterized protein n=1 Tax=Sphingomonas swuensis TaxID=977800 RepID=A0ABP7T0G6_9SPHN